MLRVDCRLVAHELPDGGRHFDLFLRVPGEEPLRTYELPSDFPPANGPLRLTAARTVPEGGAATWVYAPRKADHRPLYWDFVGELSGGRGQVRAGAVGLLYVVGEAELGGGADLAAALSAPGLYIRCP